jgi:hypothetical protein
MRRKPKNRVSRLGVCFLSFGVAAELKAKIQVGIEQLDRGDTAEFNLEEFLAARHAERRRADAET